MKSSIRLFAAAVLCHGLASCSLLADPWSTKDDSAQARSVAPAELPPIATHRFELQPGQDVVGVVQITTSTEEDTLTDIARRFNVGYEEIVRANPDVDPWLPGEGRQIVVPTQYVLPDAPREGLVLNVAAMRLFYFPPAVEGEPQVVYTHPIGIGKVGWATPEGVTRVVRRKKDPVWRPTPSIIEEHRRNGEDLPAVVGPGPDNPLGRHALYLAWPTYLIHGTNKPAGVGLRSSHGCIRLYPEDIALLFDLVPDDAPVRVVNQPYVFGWRDGRLYMQAYDVLEDDSRDWEKEREKLLRKALAAHLDDEAGSTEEQVDWDLILALAHEPRGLPVPVLGPDASLQAVLAAAPRVLNRVPDDATWDGQSDLPMDDETFQQMFSDSQLPAATTDAEQEKTGT